MIQQRNTTIKNKLIQFNGLDTYLNINQQINITPSQGFIIDFWMKPEQKATDSTILYTNNIYGNCPLVIGFVSNSFQANINGNSFPLFLDTIYGTWNHFAFYFDAVNSKAGWYLNGNPVMENPISIQNFVMQSISIGAINIASFFKGNLALVRLWTKFDSFREITKLCHSYYTEKCEDLFLQLELVNGLDPDAVVNSGNWFTPQYEGAPNFVLNGTSKWVDCEIPFSGLLSENVLQVSQSAAYNLFVESGFTVATGDFSIEFWLCPFSKGKRTLFNLNQMRKFPGITIGIVEEGGFAFSYQVQSVFAKSKVITWDYEWHHYSFKFIEKEGTFETYRDGELFDTLSLPPSDTTYFNTQQSSINILMFYDNGFSFQFSELRFWNRYLSNEDEKRLSTCRVSVGEPGLCGYFPFSENSINLEKNYLGIGKLSNPRNSANLTLVKPLGGQFSTAFLKNCFTFNGSSSQLNYYSYSFTTVSAFSLDLWISRLRFDTSEMVFDSAILKVGFTAENEMIVWVNNGSQMIKFPLPYKNKMWYNWAFSLNNVNNFFGCYLDGDLIYSIQVGNLVGFNAFSIGSEIYSGQKFKGSIGNLSIWNKSLVQDEIIGYSNKRLSGLEPGLMHYYTFDNFENDLVKDECKRVDLPGLSSGLVSPGNSVVANFTGQVPRMKNAAQTLVNNKYLEEIAIAKDKLNKAVLDHENKIKNIFYKIEKKLNATIPELLSVSFDESVLKVSNRNKEFKSEIQLPAFAAKGNPFIDPLAGKVISVEPNDIMVVVKFPSYGIKAYDRSRKLLIDNTNFEIVFNVRFNDPNAANYLGSFGMEIDGQGFQINYQADGKVYFGSPGNNVSSFAFDKHDKWQYIRIQYNLQNRSVVFYQNQFQKGTFYLRQNLLNTPIYPSDVIIGSNFNNYYNLNGHLAGIYIFRQNIDYNYNVLDNLSLGYGCYPEIKLAAIWNLYVKKGHLPNVWIGDENYYYNIYNIDNNGYTLEASPYQLPPHSRYAVEFRGVNSYIELGKIPVSDNCNVGFSFMMEYQKLKRRGFIFNLLNETGSSQCSIQVNEKDDVEFVYLGQVFTVESYKYSLGWNSWDIFLNASTRQLRVFINQNLVLEIGVSNILELSTTSAYLGCDKPNGYSGFIGKISGFKVYKQRIYSIPFNERWLTTISGMPGSDFVFFNLPFRDLNITNNPNFTNYAFNVQGSYCRLINCTWRYDINVGQSVVLLQSDLQNNISKSLLPFSHNQPYHTNTFSNGQSVVGFDMSKLFGKFGFVGGVIFTFNLTNLSYSTTPNQSTRIDSASDRIRMGTEFELITKRNTAVGLERSFGIVFEPKLIPELNLQEEIIIDFLKSYVQLIVAQGKNLYYFSHYYPVINKIELSDTIKGIATLPTGPVFQIYLQNGQVFSFDFELRTLSFEANMAPSNRVLRQFFAIDKNVRVDENIKLGLMKRKEQLLALNQKLALTKAKYLTQFEVAIKDRQKVDDRISAYLNTQNELVAQQKEAERRKIQSEIKVYQDKIAAQAAARRKVKQELETELLSSIEEISKSVETVEDKAGRIQQMTQFMLNQYPYQSVNLTQEEWNIINKNNN
ncbi:MAG: hypothetical protein CFE21_08215 [Bacteroidetes bacterium B1(2017)]|nr:MAG: hypothetical protein CFE21_08215 [Bacteroidetes bacterium B1(2017)]